MNAELTLERRGLYTYTHDKTRIESPKTPTYYYETTARIERVVKHRVHKNSEINMDVGNQYSKLSTIYIYILRV